MDEENGFSWGKAPSMDDPYVEPVEEEATQEIEEEKPAPKKTKKKGKENLTEVLRIASLRHQNICIVECVETGIGYVVPLDTKFVRGKAKLRLSDFEVAYDWSDEIDEMLPDDIEVIKHNIRRSIWASGGSKPGKGRAPYRLNLAFPYQLKE